MNAIQLNEVTDNILNQQPVCDAIQHAYSINEYETDELQSAFQNFYGFNIRDYLSMYNKINAMNNGFNTFDAIEHRFMLLSFWQTCPPDMYPPDMEF